METDTVSDKKKSFSILLVIEGGRYTTACNTRQIAWYLLPLMMCIIIFCNHFTRDSVGAVEKELEKETGLSASQYASLNTVYFTPNIFMVLLTSFASDNSERAEKQMSSSNSTSSKLLLLTAVFAGLGNIFFAIGVQTRSLILIYIGRLMAGMVYELIDTLPTVCLGPLYEKHWSIVVGASNSFLRLGSVFNFIISPLIYNTFERPGTTRGISATFWFAAFVAGTGIVSAIFGIYFERVLLAERSEFTGNGNQITEVSTTNESRGTSTAPKQTLYSRFLAVMPLHDFSDQYYYFLSAAVFLYGSMVPFWFSGSKFLQEGYGLSVVTADLLLLLPEGCITVISMPLGIALNYAKLSLKSQLKILSASVMLLPISYIILVIFSERSLVGLSFSAFSVEFRQKIAVITMVVLGIGYGISNSICWSTAIFVICKGSSQDKSNKRLLGPGLGLLGSGMSLLPAIVPPLGQLLVNYFHSEGIFFVFLALIGFSSSVCYALSSFENVDMYENEESVSSHSLNMEDMPKEKQFKFQSNVRKLQGNYVAVNVQENDDDDHLF